MSNHLDQVLRNAEFQLQGEAGMAFATGQRQSKRTEAPAAAGVVKSGFDFYPVESGRDITGRWRPLWSEDGADNRA